MTDPVTRLESRLADLEARGVRGWDAGATQLVARLVTAARQANEDLAERLCLRAAYHLSQLESAFAAARTRAEAMLERLADAGHVQTSAWAPHLERGAFDGIARQARRYPQRQARLRDQMQAQRKAALEARAEARGITSPGMLSAPSADALAATLYRDAAAGTSAKLALARAVASAPEDAGHYNPIHVATRVLETISTHPTYLTAQLARLEVLALLQDLADPKKRASGS